MTLRDQWDWRGDTPVLRPATRHRFGGSANLEAFTDTRWVTIRGDIAPDPF
jgi:benzaldehyde dehydrogenase (NAD)